MFDSLLQPIKIGPKIMRNRLFAASHGVGLGHRIPDAMIAIRKQKAEGGWGAVATEQAEIHPSSDMSPFVELRCWDDSFLPTLRKVSDSIKGAGALSVLELSHSGLNVSNLGTRHVPLSPSTLPTLQFISSLPEPYYAKEMTVADIQAFRGWHRDAVRRGLRAGFDVILIYSMSFLSLLHQFICPLTNSRSDAYGGSLDNRTRLLREVITDTKKIVGNKAAVGVRVSLEDFVGSGNEGVSDFFSSVGVDPDFWDVSFFPRGFSAAGTGRADFPERDYLDSLGVAKNSTGSLVTTTRFFDTPEKMAAFVRHGTVDFVTVARQSIADPFLPLKLKQDSPRPIRSCIKCNTCVSGDLSSVAISCTQNPAFGEEWRRGWHPEEFPLKGTSEHIAIIGGGLSGIEAARVLGYRGYDVTIFERASSLGGRANYHARIPGMHRHLDVVRERVEEIHTLSNVSVRLGVELTPHNFHSHIQEGSHIALAVGSKWDLTFIDRFGIRSIDQDGAIPILDASLALNSEEYGLKTVIYDFDFDYLAAGIAEKLSSAGDSVIFITPEAEVAPWTHKTMEQRAIHKRLLLLGVQIVPYHEVISARSGVVRSRSIFTDDEQEFKADRIVIVGIRRPKLVAASLQSFAQGYLSVTIIGEAFVPGTFAQSIRSGYKFGVEFDSDVETVLHHI